MSVFHVFQIVQMVAKRASYHIFYFNIQLFPFIFLMIFHRLKQEHAVIFYQMYC